MTDLVDVHAHLAPINAVRLASIQGVEWRPAENVMVLDGHRLGMRALFEPQQLVRWMDQRGVARALVSIPPPLYRQDLPSSQALPWVTYLAEELLAMCAASGGRLGALLHLPMEHPDLIATTLNEFGDAGFEGIALAAGGHPNIDYADACYELMWSWMDDRGSFVFVHPGACRDPRLDRFYLENLVGNPYETGVAAAMLVMKSVPSRYPGIRFCLAHAGGVFTTLVGRLQRGFDTARPGVDLDAEAPMQAARRFYVDGIAHHPALVQMIKDIVGDDHVLFGSDWPFPMGMT
ncbi:aminocarboxymuconate-semialdehyde decarboxylase [Variovorax boronicumulans]|uniref:Aminocarboxymuconate-semialdehyde decarboxylase n=1 Tax=Variovorax boronicumulans TaxID=436515 RepID=A0AAW8DA74_9BURK|nr:amidohydrolase family protein [Variovorax boronicumulans]MDP9896847.1 aminocarboxymuconate-semialdehyde decarboxylase [Variovorax boronicumulans]MDQ0056829.1 aminocarboxymuconate-semialdehyde decarboxylase [Variovorax boronicumulans]